MYHRGHPNQSIEYSRHNNMNRRINNQIYQKQYQNVSISPNSLNKSISHQSSSPTLSYELPYQLHPPLAATLNYQHHLHHHRHHHHQYNNNKNKSPISPKQLQFMSKITEETVNSHKTQNIANITPSPPPQIVHPPPPRSSPSPSPIPMEPKEPKKPSKRRKNSNNNNNNKYEYDHHRAYSDDTLSGNISNELSFKGITIHKPLKMMNSTSNRSYRKYKTRINKKNQHKRRKHHYSEHELSQNKHRNTHKKDDNNKYDKDSNNKTRKKHRAQSTVLSSEINDNPSDDDDNDEYEYQYDANSNYYESKKSSQDSYVQNIQKIQNMHNRPKTARPQTSKYYKHKIRNNYKHNGSDDDVDFSLSNSSNKKHHKSQSHGDGTVHHKKSHRSNNHHSNNHHSNASKHHQHRQHHNNNKHNKHHKRSKLHKTTKRKHFNEGAMDYMSAEQQLLYLYDYTAANVLNRSSASRTTSVSSTTKETNTSKYTDNQSITNTVTSTHTISDRGSYKVITDGIPSRLNDVGISLRCAGPQSQHTPSYSNRCNGINSDAITPQSELHVSSSPIAISCPYPISYPGHSHRDNHHSLKFLTSPPISPGSKMSKYSQLSTRAVTYSPAAHPKLHHYAYTINNTLYHRDNNHNNSSHRDHSHRDHSHRDHSHRNHFHRDHSHHYHHYHRSKTHSKHHRKHRSPSNERIHSHHNDDDDDDEQRHIDDDDVCFIASDPSLPNLPSPHYLFRLDSNSENDFPITPFSKREIEQLREASHHTIKTHTNPAIIIHPDPDQIVNIQHDGNDEAPLLEIPASLTAEESGACYLEGENRFDIHHQNDQQEEDDNDSCIFPTTPPIYKLMINDQEWHDVNHQMEHIKTPSHRIRQQLLRNSKLKCTV